MSAPLPSPRSTNPTTDLQLRFLVLLPRVELHGRVYFRHLKCAEAKGEAVRLRGAAPLRVERERQNTGQYQAEQKARRFHLRIVGPHRNSSVRLQADVRKKQDDPRGPAKGIPARIAFDSEYKG